MVVILLRSYLINAEVSLATELQTFGGPLRVQGGELPGRGPTWMHSDSAKEMFVR
jgi:hypothetical protein